MYKQQEEHFTLGMVSHPLSSTFRGELELMHKCQRELDDGTKKTPIEKLRLMCLARGANGIIGLGRAFHHMDDDGKKTLSLEKFTKALHQFTKGYECTDEEAAEIFKEFDTDEVGIIYMFEFLAKLRPPISEGRLEIIGKAFKKLDKTGSGEIFVDDLKRVYSVEHHPEYITGELTKEQILDRFLGNFEVGEITGGRITEVEFFSYYAGVSASIDDDGFFDLLMRQLYKL